MPPVTQSHHQIVRGRAHVYTRPHINTDEILPGRYLALTDASEMARHAMETIDPGFSQKVRPGDILVAGEDFGAGSSREHAVWALKETGLAAIIATSFARIFFRNAINNGFLVIECRGVADTTQCGDELEIDLSAGTIQNLTREVVHSFPPLSDFVREILAAGGLLPLVFGEPRNPEV